MSPLSHNRPAPADVFILGAGFSKAISRDMPLLAELSSKVAHQLAPNGGHVPFLSENVELALTFLAQPQPWMSEGTRHRNRAAFLDVTETIAAELTRVSTGVLVRPIPPWLQRFVHWLHFRKATVVTLNYDTLLEEAVMEVPGIGCTARQMVPIRFAGDHMMAGGDVHGDSLELLKLHGSANWRYSGRQDYAGELIHFDELVGWPPKRERVQPWKSGGTVPLLVPPVADKGNYFVHHSIRHLWQRARLALEAATRVFCIGYSFPVTDLTMRFLLADVKRQDAVEFYLVNRPTAVGDYRTLLKGTVFRLDERFVGIEPAEPFVDALFSDEFYPEPNYPVPDTQGPIEGAIRARVKPGIRFPVLENGSMAVRELTSRSITLLIDEASVPLTVPWMVLEKLMQMIRTERANRVRVRDLDSDLKFLWRRDLGQWVATLFQEAGVGQIVRIAGTPHFFTVWHPGPYA